MYEETYLDSFELVIGHEGGFTDRPSDPGNWTGGKRNSGRLVGTKFGISAAAYPHLDIPNISIEKAREIYYNDYWLPSGAASCKRGLSHAVFDSAVNNGVGRAIRWLQAAVGVSPDGALGPKSLSAIKTADPIETLREFQAQRTWHHMKLDSMDDEYGLGWSRRIIGVTLEAIAMMESSDAPKPTEVVPVPPKPPFEVYVPTGYDPSDRSFDPVATAFQSLFGKLVKAVIK